MIVPMKQLTLLTSSKERMSALKKLRKLGVVHIKSIKTPSSDELSKIEHDISNCKRVLSLFEDSSSSEKESKNMDVSQVVAKILSSSQQREALTNELADLKQDFEWFDQWGRISLATLEKIQQAGLFIRFYKTDNNSFKKLSRDKQIFIVKEDKNSTSFAFFTDSQNDKLDFVEQRIPQVEVSKFEKRIAEIEKQIKSIDQEISKLSQYQQSIKEYLVSLSKRLELYNVLYGMGEEQQFAYLQGYCPDDQIEKIKNTAEKEAWGYIVQEPEDPTDVPTLLRNKKPIRIIQPLFDFMGTLPGYYEQDISHVFLFFFSIFYAMIIGDAGYGLVFLALTFWARSKNKNAAAEPFILFYVLSITTIIWGLLTGTWFGAKAISEWPVLNMFIIEKMYSFNTSAEATNFMMKFAFIVGIIHLTVARLLAGIKKLPSVTGVADFGWILILWCVFFVANQLVLGEMMPPFAIYLLIAGSVLVGLFANFQKNILKGFLITIGNLPLNIVSSFSDIVSYIRLFAVGIATVTVAESFNNMAIGQGISSIFAGIIAAIVLVLGHGLNIILGLMSVLVHGVRLNMLEFSGHLGQEWTGKEYKPFKE